MKRAQVEYVLNKAIALLVAILIVFCIVGAVGSALWSRKYVEESWYLNPHQRESVKPASNDLKVEGIRGLQVRTERICRGCDDAVDVRLSRVHCSCADTLCATASSSSARMLTVIIAPSLLSPLANRRSSSRISC